LQLPDESEFVKTFGEHKGRSSQTIIEIKSNKKLITQCLENNLPSTPIRLRLIRVKLKKETEILVINLLDDEQYPVNIINELYHLRWGIEENYKRQKCKTPLYC